MRIRMLLAAARMFAAAYPGCAGEAAEAGTRMEPAAAVVHGRPTRSDEAPAHAPEVSLNAATSTPAAPRAPRAIPDDALIKPLENPYSVDGAESTGPLPMFGAILMQRTKDVDSWQRAFEESRAQRQRAGFVAQGMMRGTDDPQLVAVWLAVTDVARAKQYFADKTINERLRSAGALGPTELRLSSNVVAKMEPGRTGLHAALLRLRMADVAAFKAAFVADEEARQAAGVVGYSLGQDVDDEHLLYMYLQSEDAALLKAYVNAKQTKQGWRDAGVHRDPRVVLVKEGELTLCR